MTTTKREDVLDGIGQLAPDWRIEDDDCRRLKVRNRDGYLADVSVSTNPATSERNRNAAVLIARAPALVDEIRELRDALRACVDSLVDAGREHAPSVQVARTLLPHTPETHDGD